jgi:hypothetical protein
VHLAADRRRPDRAGGRTGPRRGGAERAEMHEQRHPFFCRGRRKEIHTENTSVDPLADWTKDPFETIFKERFLLCSSINLIRFSLASLWIWRNKQIWDFLPEEQTIPMRASASCRALARWGWTLSIWEKTQPQCVVGQSGSPCTHKGKIAQRDMETLHVSYPNFPRNRRKG